jgi:hypothetical protein
VKKGDQQPDLHRQHGAGPREPAGELRRLQAVAVRNGSRKAVIRAVERRLRGGVQELRGPVQRVNERAELVQSHETALRAAAVAPAAAVDPLRARDDRQGAMCVRLGKDLDAATAPPQLVSERRNSVVTRHAAAKSGTRLWRSLFLGAFQTPDSYQSSASEKCCGSLHSPKHASSISPRNFRLFLYEFIDEAQTQAFKQTRYTCGHLSR